MFAQLGHFARRRPFWAVVAPLLAALLLAAAWVGQGRASSAEVSRVRFGVDSKITRVVVDLTRSTSGRMISEDATPHVDLVLTGIGAGGGQDGPGAGVVRRWRLRPGVAGAHLSLDLVSPATVRRRFLLPPADGVNTYRYVIDLEAVGTPTSNSPMPAAEDSAEAGGLSADASSRGAESPDGRKIADARKIIVIDPGHGGKDPGAIGGATREKSVTLAAAMALKARLERSGRYQVILTRQGDSFIALPERVAIARRAGADLFISLHANADADRRLRGASVYTLSERGADRAARKVMSGGDWLSNGGRLPGPNAAVNRILLDLTQRATQNRSSTFARVLLDRLDGRTPLLQKSHRDAGFVVLLAPDVPAVLLEMGFITNPQDEAMLNDRAGRDRLVDGVAQAVDAYFGGERAGQATLASR